MCASRCSCPVFIGKVTEAVTTRPGVFGVVDRALELVETAARTC